MSTDWKQRVAQEATRRVDGDPERKAYYDANLDAVRDVVTGVHQDKKTVAPGTGARVVFNIASRHVPAFCEQGYRNAYELGTASPTRRQVDEAIEGATGLAKESIYFGALELSGTGIGFYGDFCLVLNDAEVERVSGSLQVLDRNSYDVTRAPAVDEIQISRASSGLSAVAAMADKLKAWRGTWRIDLPEIVASKVQGSLPVARRRWTTGQIAAATLDDEDYIEVLYPRSFGTASLAEVRLSAADAAAEADVANREARGEDCSAEEMTWRHQRRGARTALAAAGVKVRVVTTLGRVRGD